MPRRWKRIPFLRGGLDGLAAVPPYGDPGYEGAGRGELIAVHGVATSYRKRSHFDARSVLELGLATPHAGRQGWLNRALPVLGTRTSGDDAMAIGQALPLVLRGPESVGSWAPARTTTSWAGYWPSTATTPFQDPASTRPWTRIVWPTPVAGGLIRT